MDFRGKDLRKGRYSHSQYIYHITTVVEARKPVFDDLYTARVLVNSLRFADQQGWSSTLAYVVMPDHLHWLLQLGDKRTLSQLVAAVKQRASHEVTALLWQRGFHDHAIRADEDLKQVARYIVNNPVKDGLVEDIRKYSHWDVMWL